jgi:antitoxin YefM
MQTIYRLKASELNHQFLEGLKATFKDKDIEIIVSEIDETEYLLKSPANKQRLLSAIENVNNNTNLIEVDWSSLELNE